MGSVTEARQTREFIQQPQSHILKSMTLCPCCVFCMCVCVSVCGGVCSNVSGVDTEPAQHQPAMTDWRRLPSCAGCSFVVELVCVFLYVYLIIFMRVRAFVCVCETMKD